jgi:hypothetical protein
MFKCSVCGKTIEKLEDGHLVYRDDPIAFFLIHRWCDRDQLPNWQRLDQVVTDGEIRFSTDAALAYRQKDIPHAGMGSRGNDK